MSVCGEALVAAGITAGKPANILNLTTDNPFRCHPSIHPSAFTFAHRLQSPAHEEAQVIKFATAQLRGQRTVHDDCW